ncbi:MAG: hypothetical protein FWC50_15465 [Planctomycetaceae bacterium]|nr:hypothetical protein [Planctomycetaceae bacterium]
MKIFIEKSLGVLFLLSTLMAIYVLAAYLLFYFDPASFGGFMPTLRAEIGAMVVLAIFVISTVIFLLYQVINFSRKTISSKSLTYLFLINLAFILLQWTVTFFVVSR